jgi:NitT/TauT family transport system substrate-binding protein
MLRSKSIIVFLAVILSVGFIFLLFSYFQQSQKTKETQEIKVKLKWVHQAQFTGNYVANEKGFYADEGLKVKLFPFSFEDPTIEAVADGRAVFGIAGAGELLIARSKGLPLRAFAVIYKINPVCAYSLKKSGIIKPQDFIGKTVGIERGASVEISYSIMMQKLGIDRSKIKEVTIGYDATELLNGETDVSTGYIINEPQQAIAEGYDVNTILMADYGGDMYADVLFATEDTINNGPILVEKFLRATLKGWQYAIENEEEVISYVLKYTTDRTEQHESYMLQQSIPLIHTGDSPLGWMEKEKWERAQSILLEQNILDKEMDITEAYTMKFLKNIYD